MISRLYHSWNSSFWFLRLNFFTFSFSGKKHDAVKDFKNKAEILILFILCVYEWMHVHHMHAAVHGTNRECWILYFCLSSLFHCKPPTYGNVYSLLVVSRSGLRRIPPHTHSSINSSFLTSPWGREIAISGSYRQLWTSTCMLRMIPRSSAGSWKTFNHWAIVSFL